MLDRATPIEFSRTTTNGRTRPAIVVCETAAGDQIDVVAKFSASCDQGVVNLAREAVAACLAADPGLPIPKPFLLDIQPEWAAGVADPVARAAIQRSAPFAFGSTWVGPQVSAWNDGTLLRLAMHPAALGIFVFDAIIQNPDRRSSNPNCPVLSEAMRSGFSITSLPSPTASSSAGHPRGSSAGYNTLCNQAFTFSVANYGLKILTLIPLRSPGSGSTIRALPNTLLQYRRNGPRPNRRWKVR